MSEQIKHECGIALIRLRKPLSYYIEKHGTPMYAINKMYLLMEKQRNRGQDGAGVASVKISQEPGKPFVSHLRSVAKEPIQDIFEKIAKKYEHEKAEHPELVLNAKWATQNLDFAAELLMGHLRYGTHGKSGIEFCHPMLRGNNWRSRNLIAAGNFNMTNVDELYNRLVEIGQHPQAKSDTITVLEKIGHFLDEENFRLLDKYKSRGFANTEIMERISEEMNLQRVLQRACKDFDGGYAMMGMTGCGNAFVARDPAGIRPAYYYADDDVIVVASEKPAIKTAFNPEYDQIKEIQPGFALLIGKNGAFEEKQFIEPAEKKSCSFERIYFSRGTDPIIYQERKKLGRLLVKQVLEAVNYDLTNTVFSYIPNTAETAFLGMVEEVETELNDIRRKALKSGKLSKKASKKLHKTKPRIEKLVIKDAKLRTFITDDNHRDDLVAHVYDTTYEVINKGTDTIVVIDDSIVRGTTIEKSILTMLDRLGPKKIIIVSSAPQIRFPDCYGIDMSVLQGFIAFRAMLKLLEDRKMKYLLEEVYEKCKASLGGEASKIQNHVKELFAPFSDDEISGKIAEMLKTPAVKSEVQVIFQTVGNLHKAIPNHLGDWYFTGDYPTWGGNRVVNTAFINFMEGKEGRAY